MPFPVFICCYFLYFHSFFNLDQCIDKGKNKVRMKWRTKKNNYGFSWSKYRYANFEEFSYGILSSLNLLFLSNDYIYIQDSWQIYRLTTISDGSGGNRPGLRPVFLHFLPNKYLEFLVDGFYSRTLKVVKYNTRMKNIWP